MTCSLLIAGPEDVSINQPSLGLYQASVTLTARMWPPVEAGSPTAFLGVPVSIWLGIIVGSLIIVILAFVSIFLWCWLIPRRRQKVLSPTHVATSGTTPITCPASTIPPTVDSGKLLSSNRCFRQINVVKSI